MPARGRTRSSDTAAGMAPPDLGGRACARLPRSDHRGGGGAIGAAGPLTRRRGPSAPGRAASRPEHRRLSAHHPRRAPTAVVGPRRRSAISPRMSGTSECVACPFQRRRQVRGGCGRAWAQHHKVCCLYNMVRCFRFAMSVVAAARCRVAAPGFKSRGSGRNELVGFQRPWRGRREQAAGRGARLRQGAAGPPASAAADADEQRGRGLPGPAETTGRRDVSTLRSRGHFYLVATRRAWGRSGWSVWRRWGDGRMPSSRDSAFRSGRTRGTLPPTRGRRAACPGNIG